jgi:hypothetical protein
MNRRIVAMAAAAIVALPLASPAQPAGGPGPGGPPPALRAKADKILGDARIAAFEALRPDHRSTVRAIADQVAARSLDPRGGARKIDVLLTADERTRLAAVERQLRTDMRAAMGRMDRPPDGAPPGGGPPPGGPPPAGPPPGGAAGAPSPGAPGFAGRTPDPGRFLLMLSRSRRSIGPEPRSNGAP